MPFPLLALAVPALIGVVGSVGIRYIEGRVTGRPATPGQLLRAGLLGGIIGVIGGNVVNLARLAVRPATTATVVVVGAWRADETARTMNDFVETGRLPYGLQWPGGAASTSSTPPAPPAPEPPRATPPLFRPLFDSVAARERLAARLEESAGTGGTAPSLLLPPTPDPPPSEGLARPRPTPTLGLTGALQR